MNHPADDHETGGRVERGRDAWESDRANPNAQFDGDTSPWPAAARRAVVALMKRTYFNGADHPREWKALLDYEAEVRQWLHSVFLDLVLDEPAMVAYKRQAVSRDVNGEAATLLTSRAYSRYEAAILVWVRQQWHQARSQSRPVVTISRDDLLANIAYVTPAGARDRSAAGRDMATAIRNLCTDRLLRGVDGNGDTATEFTVSPVIPLVMSVDRVEQFAALLQAADEPEPAADRAGPDLPADDQLLAIDGQEETL